MIVLEEGGVIEPSLPCENVRWTVEEAVADVVNDVHPVLEPLFDGGQYGPQERRKQRDILQRTDLQSVVGGYVGQASIACV